MATKSDSLRLRNNLIVEVISKMKKCRHEIAQSSQQKTLELVSRVGVDGITHMTWRLN